MEAQGRKHTDVRHKDVPPPAAGVARAFIALTYNAGPLKRDVPSP
jgi:hypothetical protein